MGKLKKAVRNPFVLGGISLSLILFGAWLVFFQPNMQAKKAFYSAIEATALSNSEINKFKERYELSKDWYGVDYLEIVSLQFKQCQEKLDLANKEIEIAKNSKKAKEKRIHSEGAENIIKDMSAIYSQMSESFTRLEGVVAHNRDRLARAQEELSKAEPSYDSVLEAFQNESGGYLSKYISQMNENLEEGQKRIDEARNNIARAVSSLPNEGDTTRSGDPKNASKLLDESERNLNLAKTAISNLAKEIVLQKEAKDKAEKSVFTANSRLTSADVYLREISKKTKLSPDKALKAAFEKYNEADLLLKEAKAALATEVEAGKYDFVLSYISSTKASEAALGAISEADKQAEMAKEAIEKIKILKACFTAAQASIFNSYPSLRILENNHRGDSWVSVANNLKNAEKLLDEIRDSLISAKTFVSDESFESCISQAQRGLVKAEKIQANITELNNAAERLERYREEWPQKERMAVRTIKSEMSDIDQYGRYDSSAKSDFDEAEELLASARALAGARNYEIAVEKAMRSANLAEGTGDKAREAYEESQRRKRAEEDDDDSTFDSFTFGGSTSGGSDSYDSGSGGSSWGGSLGGSGSDSGGWGSSGGSDGGGWSGGSGGSDGGGWGD